MKYAASAGWLGLVALILAGFHFWGESAREREWRWLAGNEDGMRFVDVSDAKDRRGHLLTVLKDEAGAGEFAIRWSCAPPQIAYDELWELDNDMLQVERTPPPERDRELRAPRDDDERAALEIACASEPARATMRTFRIERPPIEMTHLAFRLLEMDVNRFGALMLSGGAPVSDQAGYERMIREYVAEGRRAQVRELTGARAP